MYDLNLNIPNITSKKYSNDNRFLLLKNYLYELNETLAFALADNVAQEVALVSEKNAEDNKKQREDIQLFQTQSASKFKEIKEDILNIQGYENLNCERTEKSTAAVAEIRYYPGTKLVFARIRLETSVALAANTTHYLAKIPGRTPGMFTPLQSFANLVSGGQSSAGVIYKTGDVVFRSDVEVPAGTTVYISGCYIADYEEKEG